VELLAATREAAGQNDDSFKVKRATDRRHVTIIDSLKHPKESAFLREVYGSLYWQIAVFAPESIRESRLKANNVKRSEIASVFERDDNAPKGSGQKVSKTSFLSDFFIRNDGQNHDNLDEAIKRFLILVFNLGVNTPTSHEKGMYAAVSAASNSACLSRQVGAAIFSKSSELVSIGWNDVPKFGGGLYSQDDLINDNRCFKWGGECYNDSKKNKLYEEIFNSLLDTDLVKSSDKSKILSALKETSANQLIEYSRAVHAEMEAITSAARQGKSGLVDGILYSTTYPCHNCARHIVAAGITHVFFIEPYAKSLAIELHSDSISSAQNAQKRVQFLQYEGVGPKAMLRLFQNGNERKSDGHLIEIKKKDAVPVIETPLDGFSTHEKRVIERLVEVEGDSDATEAK
jgi:deoxycytidylate deaminase